MWSVKAISCSFILSIAVAAAISGRLFSQTSSVRNNSVISIPQFHEAISTASRGVVSIKAVRAPRREFSLPAETTTADERGGHQLSHEPRLEDLDDGFETHGSGVIFDERGHIITCQHGLKSADRVIVQLDDGRTFVASEILVDEPLDLAVIKVPDATDLPVPIFADSDDLQVGDWVLSIGNPYGIGKSVSAGIVSAKERYLTGGPACPLIQSDSASNPGNSGGALVDLKGRIVGISEGGYGQSEGFQGISFALPSNVVVNVAKQLIRSGRVRRAYLGCSTQAVEGEIIEHLGANSTSGLLVTCVDPRSPAEAAGLLVGDLLIRVKSEMVSTNSALTTLLLKTAPGTSVEATIIRNRNKMRVNIKLGELHRPTITANPSHDASPLLPEAKSSLPFAVANLSRSDAAKLGYDEDVVGVLITTVAPGSDASVQGIRPSMVVTRVEQTSIKNVEDYSSALHASKESEKILHLIATPSGSRFVLLDIGGGNSPAQDHD
jgi:serine protease Do